MPSANLHDLEARIKLLESEIENHQQTIASLQHSEQKYRHFFEKSPTMIYVVDMKGRFLNINAAGVVMLGFQTPDQIIGKFFYDFFPVNITSEKDSCELPESHGPIRDVETQMRRADGTVREVQMTAAMRTSVTGKLKGYEGFVIDITTRKDAEKKLAESEAKYRTVLENSLAAIYMFQGGGYLRYVNPRMVSMLGYERAEEIIGRPFWEFIGEEDRKVVKERGLRREKGEVFPRRYKYRMLKKDQSEIWVDMRASNASYMGSPAVVGNFIDITKEKIAEEEIRQLSQRLINVIEEERRSLAADLHDEFGQALTLLQLDVESLHNSLPEDRRDCQAICLSIMEQIQQLADRVRDTTSRLRPDMLDHLGLVPTLHWSVEDLRQRWSDIDIVFQSIGLKKRLLPDAELVLYRVFQESLNNIRRHARAKRVTIQLTYSHPRVIFIVKDDGRGFDATSVGLPENHYRLGIGLLSMKERVASLGGTLQINSAPRKGTTIRVELPFDGSLPS